jgi:hypothetical protein
MHLTIPIKIEEELGENDNEIVVLETGEGSPIIATDGYINKDLLEKLVTLFNNHVH